MYTDSANDFSQNNNGKHDNEEMQANELFSYQTMNSATKLSNSGE